MTKVEYKQRLEVAIALGEGKECECLNLNKSAWQHIDIDCLHGNTDFYGRSCIFMEHLQVRIKPTPKIVPWEMKDVPLGDWFKLKIDTAVHRVVGLSPASAYIAGCWRQWVEMQTDFDHSSDPINGPWLSCAKEVVS